MPHFLAFVLSPNSKALSSLLKSIGCKNAWILIYHKKAKSNKIRWDKYLFIFASYFGFSDIYSHKGKLFVKFLTILKCTQPVVIIELVYLLCTYICILGYL